MVYGKPMTQIICISIMESVKRMSDSAILPRQKDTKLFKGHLTVHVVEYSVF